MDISFFFDPISSAAVPVFERPIPQTLSRQTQAHTDEFPDWMSAEIIVMGIPESRGSLEGSGCEKAPNPIREKFYRLSSPVELLSIADLGNLKLGETVEDTCEKLRYVTEVLLKRGKIVIALGGSQEIIYGLYQAYENLELELQYVNIDNRLDLVDSEMGLNNHSVNHRIFAHTPVFLDHFVNLGSQRFLVTEAEDKILQGLNFERIRVGELYKNPRLAEPFLREADLVALDLGALRMSEAPGNLHSSPAGLTVEQACQMMRYAGNGPTCTALALCEFNPEYDLNEQTSYISALLAWHFVEGYANRKPDYPDARRQNVKTFRAVLDSAVEEIIFYQSKLSERWWMEVSPPLANGQRPKPSRLVPCTEEDYQRARAGEIPPRWWVFYRKMMG
jgi:formiminoglutamase